MTLPLQGIRIIEMGQLIAVPHAVKMLADMGAQVIRVESCVRLEGYRTSSFYENDPGEQFWNHGANFYEQNRNKLGLTLDLARPEGLSAMKELISISDVFVENFTPRVMKNFGLEYEDLRLLKPDIIMVSSTGYGYSGPWSGFGAVGPTTEAASGLSYMTGYNGGPPELPEMPYTDYTAAEHTVFAIMAALIHRARTGMGQFIAVSQAQTSSSTIPEALMDYTVNGRIRERIGNQDESMAPHGCYPCLGKDNWIAIAVSNDAEWNALCDVLGSPTWHEDARFHDGLSRWQHRDELDELVSEITGKWEQDELMRALQGRGVPAGAVLNNKQLLFDPHLKAREFYKNFAHHPSTGIPTLPYPGRPWKLSEVTDIPRVSAPIMGEHNRFLLTEFLGKEDADIEALEEDGVIGYEPIQRQTPPVVSLDDQMRQGRILDYDEDFKEQVRREYEI